MPRLTAEEAERTPEEWIDLIRDGYIKFSDIGTMHETGVRDQIIDTLLLQGRSYKEIKGLLKCSDPTIYYARTRLKAGRPAEIVQANTQKYIDEFTIKAEMAQQKLHEIANDDDSDPAHKIKAVNSAYDIAKQTIEKLEDWGFIRRQAKQIDYQHKYTLEISEEEKQKKQLEDKRLDAIEAEIVSVEADANNGTIDTK